MYPQGNWVEIVEETPYFIIGTPSYGKPVLDRTLTFHDSMPFALKVGCLAFDSTRISAANVDFPIDGVMYANHRFQLAEHRHTKDDLMAISTWWQERLRQSVHELPAEWIEERVAKMARRG